jgi:hypothetical protein
MINHAIGGDMHNSIKTALLASVCFGALASNAAFAAVAENIVYDLGVFKISIPRIETTGGTLTDAQLKSLLDPRSNTSVAQRLGDFVATSVTAPQINFEISGPVSNTVTYRNLKLNNVRAGMIDSMTIDGASGDLKNPQGIDMKATYGAMSAKKLNLALIVRFMTSKRTDANEPLATAYEEFSADGFSLTSPEVDMNMGKITGSGVKMRPLATPFSEFITMTQSMNTPGAKPTPQQQQAIFGMLGDMFQSMEMARMEARDMKIKIKQENGEMGFGRIFMSGFAKARLGEVAYEGFTMNMPDGNAKLGRIGLRDFDFSRTLSTMADAAKRGDLEFKDTNPRNLVPTFGQVQISGLDLNVPDKNGQGNSEDGKRILFSLGNAELNAGNHIEGVPTSINVKVQNFAFPIPKNPADERLAPIAQFGVSKIDLSHNFDLAWNEAAREIRLGDYSINLAGLGSVKLSGVIANAPRDLFAGGLPQAQAAAMGLQIKGADLDVQNSGLMQMAIAAQAKQANQTPQQVQQMLVMGAAMGIPAMLGDSPAAKELAGALSKFAGDPKRLRISATAPGGLGFADMALLGNPVALLGKITLSASAD